MKKLVLLLAAVLMTAIGANVFAQTGTGINPATGYSYDYTVNEDANSSFAWTLTTSVDGSGDNLIGTEESDVATGSSTNHTINLTWIDPDVNTIYYLHVIQTDENNCSNHKVLAIKPANYFEMDIANVDAAGAALATTFETCAPAVVVEGWNDTDEDGNVTTADANAFTYNYGTVTFYYKVTATGITNTDWDPVFTISHNSSATVTAEWSTTIDGTYTVGLLTDGDDNTFTVTGSNEFFVKVIVANGTVEENLDAEDFTINLDETASADEYDNTVTSTNTDTIDQTITARPNTGDIQY